MIIDSHILFKMGACRDGTMRFRNEFKDRAVTLDENLWQKTKFRHICYSDVCWLARRILKPEDHHIFIHVVDAELKTRPIRNLLFKDWLKYQRRLAAIALAVLGALAPLCELRNPDNARDY